MHPLDQPNANETSDVEPRPIDALEVRVLRSRMGLTQRQFAGWFGMAVATLRHWERGNRRPAGAALVLLAVIRENPRVVLQAVRKARRRYPGSLAEIEPLKSHRAPTGFSDRPLMRRPSGPRRG